jgi:hypothetical protein
MSVLLALDRFLPTCPAYAGHRPVLQDGRLLMHVRQVSFSAVATIAILVMVEWRKRLCAHLFLHCDEDMT